MKLASESWASADQGYHAGIVQGHSEFHGQSSAEADSMDYDSVGIGSPAPMQTGSAPHCPPVMAESDSARALAPCTEHRAFSDWSHSALVIHEAVAVEQTASKDLRVDLNLEVGGHQGYQCHETPALDSPAASVDDSHVLQLSSVSQTALQQDGG